MTWRTALKWNLKFWFIVCLSGCMMVVNIKESPISLKESKTKTQEVNANLKAFNKDREVEKDTANDK